MLNSNTIKNKMVQSRLSAGKYFLLIFLFTFLVSETLNAQAVTAYNAPVGYTNIQIRSKNAIAVSSNNNEVFIGYRDIGLHKLDVQTSTWTIYDILNSSIPSNNITALKFNAANQLWVGSISGLANFFNGNWTVYNTANSGIVSDSVRSLFVTTGGVWVGTKHGLSFYNGSTFTNYNTSNSGLVNNVINCIEKDSSGNFYFGTNGGYSYYDGTNWFNTTRANSSLISDTISSIHYISTKACWISTARGMSKLSYGNIYSFADSTCIHPEYNSAYHNGARGLAKKGNFLYGINSINYSTPIVKFNEDNFITVFNDSVYNVIVSSNLGVHSAFSNNNILWIACPSPSAQFNNVLFSFNEAISMGSTFFNMDFKPNETLAGNLVTTNILNRGDMFWDLSNAKYEVPRCSNKHAIFTGALWMGGYDQTGNLHTSAMTYRQGPASDYWPGPLDTITGTTDVATVAAFDNIWKFDKTTIDDFKTNFLNGNVGNGTYPVPNDILTYPAVGTGNFSRNLAPFVDYNNDANYNAYDGDYPLIKGDQQLYWIFNDNDTLHTETNGIPMGVEIHGSAYAYYCPQFTIDDIPGVVNYTTFYNYEFYNRSSNSYDSVFVGLFTDVDLGDYNDDYVGCDSTLNIGFAYNGDNDDGSGTMSGYGLNPPMINCQILKGPEPDLNDAIDNDHDGTIDEAGEINMMSSFLTYSGSNMTPTGNPDVADDYYEYMSSRWLDGTHITYGGNGYNPGSTNNTNYFYSGTPYSATGWTETSVGNIPDDRRIVVASGPFSLAPGQMRSLDFAIVFTWDSTAANGLNTSIAKNSICNQKIKEWFDSGALANCNLLGVNDYSIHQNKFSIYPNPANDVLHVVAKNTDGNKLKYTISDITGRVMEENFFYNETTISTKKLSASVYFITIDDDKGSATKKFVKQ